MHQVFAMEHDVDLKVDTASHGQLQIPTNGSSQVPTVIRSRLASGAFMTYNFGSFDSYFGPAELLVLSADS